MKPRLSPLEPTAPGEGSGPPGRIPNRPRFPEAALPWALPDHYVPQRVHGDLSLPILRALCSLAGFHQIVQHSVGLCDSKQLDKTPSLRAPSAFQVPLVPCVRAGTHRIAHCITAPVFHTVSQAAAHQEEQQQMHARAESAVFARSGKTRRFRLG